jgi:4,4'-dithiodibutanoate disulfide reductase
VCSLNIKKVAKGGVALTTIAYSSVSRDGRTFAEQLILTPQDAPPNLCEIADAVHKHGCLLSFQLTHAGSFAERSLFLPDNYSGDNSVTTPTRAMAPSAVFDLPTLSYPAECNEVDMTRICRDFTRAATVAIEKGNADAVEVHLGHGYLLSQWLCPLTNVRRHEHGGSIANRLRFPLRILKSVREAIGPKKALFVKINVNDGFEGGLSQEDVLYMTKTLCSSEGLIDGLIPSAGFVSKNGFYMLRGQVPRRGMVRALSRSSLGKAAAMALLGRWLVPELPFEEGFLLNEARQVLRVAQETASSSSSSSSSTPILAIGGFVSLDSVEDALKEGFSAVQMARALIREPDLVIKFRKASLNLDDDGRYSSKCIHCNECVLAALTPEVSARCHLRTDTEGEEKSITDIEDISKHA